MDNLPYGRTLLLLNIKRFFFPETFIRWRRTYFSIFSDFYHWFIFSSGLAKVEGLTQSVLQFVSFLLKRKEERKWSRRQTKKKYKNIWGKVKNGKAKKIGCLLVLMELDSHIIPSVFSQDFVFLLKEYVFVGHFRLWAHLIFSIVFFSLSLLESLYSYRINELEKVPHSNDIFRNTHWTFIDIGKHSFSFHCINIQSSMEWDGVYPYTDLNASMLSLQSMPYGVCAECFIILLFFFLIFFEGILNIFVWLLPQSISTWFSVKWGPNNNLACSCLFEIKIY